MLGFEHRKFAVNISGKYMDAMRAKPGQGEIPGNEKIDSYLISDLSVNYAMQKNISLFAIVTNITDEIYSVARRPAGLRPGMPRAFNVGLKVAF